MDRSGTWPREYDREGLRDISVIENRDRVAVLTVSTMTAGAGIAESNRVWLDCRIRAMFLVLILLRLSFGNDPSAFLHFSY